MKNILLATASTLALTTSAFAADISGKITLDVAENAAGDYAATPGIEMGVEGAMGMGSIGLIVDANDAVTVDTWSVGAKAGAASVSFGDQGDLMEAFEGGTEAVGGQTLTDLGDDYESIQVEVAGVSAMVGFNDITSDVSDVKNVQVGYSAEFGKINLASAVDWDRATKDITFAAGAATEISGITAAGTVTYTDAVTGYEVSAGYGAFKGFLNGDENDMAQNVGAGAYHTYATGMSVYAETGYNLDSKDLTPAVGVAFNF